jgi:hypothetical protein
MSMIITAECEHCVYGEVFKIGKIEKVRCSYKEKEYFYGQCIPCDHKQKKRGEPEDVVEDKDLA